MKKILELFAKGNHTLTKIRDEMFFQDLVGRHGNTYSLSSIPAMLSNPFYYGMFKHKGELIQGSHKPMISKKLFDQIQEALRSNGKPRKKKTREELIFKNFAICGECGYQITGERHIKKSGLVFKYYRCTKKSKVKKCTDGFLREEKLAEQVEEICQKVSIPDEWRDKFLDKVAEWEQEENDTLGIFVQNLKEKLKEIAVKIDRLSNGYLEGAFELNEYHIKKNELVELKKTIEEELSDFERKGNHRLELLKDWIIEANRADNLAKTKNFPEMRNFLKTVGSNRILNGRLLIDLKKPFTALSKRAERAVGISDTNVLNSLWWTRSDLN